MAISGFASGTVVEQVDRLLSRAIERGASDVHVEPVSGEGALADTPSAVRVRYRIDGVLSEAGTLPASSAAGVVARIKVLASLDIAEKRRPQDGRIAFRARTGQMASGARASSGSAAVDLRVSVLPTTAGEKVVLRVLDRRALRLDFDALGLAGAHREAVSGALASPHGLVLVTGPTGSGKTTTLYAALASLDRERLNVMTVEDPVEYDVEGVSQVAARPDLEFGFAEALRSFLRQDPDVILVGEIRDAETARIAVRSALTGHLVLSTLHTNDAPSAAARLVDMGVEPYLLAASLRLVVAQRLVRLLCDTCAQPAVPGTPEAERARAVARGTLGETASPEEGRGEDFSRQDLSREDLSHVRT
ncbi:MAG: GspE/PulE family protein, partial [Bacteroidota bacterium]